MFLHQSLPVDQVPRRIVSLVPSITELLHTLSLEEEVCGITRFCIHPDHWYRSKTRIGGTKQINLPAIRALHPDLILANKEENVRLQVEELAHEFPVWLTDVSNFSDALTLIRDVGRITHRMALAESLWEALQKDPLAQEAPDRTPIPVAYLIWKDPYMTVGGDTYIHDMLRVAGFANVFEGRMRYPEVSLSDIRESGCTQLFLSSEPFPFRERHVDELTRQLPGIRVSLVDGSMFSWYGSRIRQALPYLRRCRESVYAG